MKKAATGKKYLQGVAYLKKYNIPTSKFNIFESKDNAKKFLANSTFPIVIKADGGSINCPIPPDTNIPVTIGVTTRVIQIIRFIFLFIPFLKVLGKGKKLVFIWRSKRQDYIRVKITDQE